ncbi:MAG: hypothetical protein IJY37_07615 [Clostridia bacterium]|nr:hypothetical protein [Clostridia bacterium]
MEHTYLEIAGKTKIYRLFRLKNELFLRHTNEQNENDPTLPKIETKTSRDLVLPFSQIKNISVCGDVHYDEHGKKTDLFFGDIIIETNQNHRKFEVISDITEAELLEFFADAPFPIKKKAPPTPKEDKLEKAYRKEMREKRNPFLQKCISIYLFAQLGFMIISIFLLFKHFDAVFTISAILFLINLALVLALPAYFSVYHPGKNERRIKNHDEMPIGVFLWAPIVFNAAPLLFGDYNAEGWILPTIICTLLLIAVIFARYIREVKFIKTGAIVFVLLAFLISASIIGGIGMKTMGDEPVSTQSAQIVHYRKENRRKSSAVYKITVKLPDGTEETYTIPSSMYQSKDAGDTVYLETYEGAFGMTFTYVRD